MERKEFMSVLAAFRAGAPAITGPGAVAGALWASGEEPATIYNFELGYASAVGLGVALAAPHERVISLEGDGSALAGLPTLATIGRYRPPNLVVVVFDNGVYGTGDGTVETATSHRADLAALARACGFEVDRVAAVDDIEGARHVLERVFVEPGPWFVVVRIDRSDAVSGTRPVPEIGHVEATVGFARELAHRRRASDELLGVDSADAPS